MAITAQQEELFKVYEANTRGAAAKFPGTSMSRAVDVLDTARARGKDYVMWQGTRGTIRVGPRSAFEADEEKKAKALLRKAARTSKAAQ